MERIITADGSITFRNKDVDETYHSHSGAATEAWLKYVEPSGIVALAKDMNKSRKRTIRILDFCFGLGYNSAAAIDAIRSVHPDVPVEIIALEIDPTILHLACTIDAPFESYSFIQKVCKNHDSNENNIHVKILLGDARRGVRTLDGRFDAVFFDPFSPKKAPQMWTAEVFRSLFEIMRPCASLTTFSCARLVRDNLVTAGFHVMDGPIVGRRGPSTIAIIPTGKNI